MALLIAAMLAPIRFFLRPDRLWIYLVYIAVLTAVQFLICYLKGPTPRWRWGESDQ